MPAVGARCVPAGARASSVGKRGREAREWRPGGTLKRNYGNAGGHGHGGSLAVILEKRDDDFEDFNFFSEPLQLPFFAVQKLIDVAHEGCNRKMPVHQPVTRAASQEPRAGQRKQADLPARGPHPGPKPRPG